MAGTKDISRHHRSQGPKSGTVRHVMPKKIKPVTPERVARPLLVSLSDAMLKARGTEHE